MPNLDGVSATHLIRQFDNTPIIAMTSNIRSDDISMYFQHGKFRKYSLGTVLMTLTLAGMNDVLPKPFTKEGLLNMLEKHLAHLKKQPPSIDPMGAPPAPISRASRSLKTEDSPATSPATTANWNSPNNLSGVSPVASNHAEEASMYGMSSGATAYSPGMQPSPMYSMAPMGAPRQQPPPPRRNINDISGGPVEYGGDVKRHQMYAPSQPMGQPMPRPTGPPR